MTLYSTAAPNTTALAVAKPHIFITTEGHQLAVVRGDSYGAQEKSRKRTQLRLLIERCKGQSERKGLPRSVLKDSCRLAGSYNLRYSGALQGFQ